MINFNVVRWKNFLSYGDHWTELRLDEHTKTLIVGENGAGKSTFMDALSYALFMKPFRKVNNPQLVNSINKKHMAVEVEFTIGSHHFRVCRGHAPRFFEVYKDGTLLNQEAHTKDYQQILEQQILKLNHKSFSQIVVLGSSNFTPFMQLSGPHRREIIEDLLDIQIFSIMAGILKGKVQSNKDNLTEMDHQIELIDSKIQMQEEYILKLQDNAEEAQKEKEKQIKEKEIEIKDILNELSELNTQIDKLLVDVNKLPKATKKLSQLTSLESQIEDNVLKLNKNIKFLQENDVCPTCEQDIHESFKEERIAKDKEKVQKNKDGLVEIEKAIQEAENVVDGLETLKTNVQQLQTTVAVKRQAEESLNSFIESIKKQITEAKDSTRAQEIESARNDVSKEQLDDAIAKRDKLRQDRNVLSVATDLLRDTGIKSRIVKQYVPVINKLVNKYLAAMDFFVQFHLDEDFKEVIRSRHRDDFSYDSFSECEKMRIDLSLLFTWRAIAKMKNSAATNLLVLDEVFDSALDVNGTDEFMRIINELTLDQNTFIISHKTDQLLDKFHNVVKFEKHKNFSRIVQ